jgi:hypothetical protein
MFESAHGLAGLEDPLAGIDQAKHHEDSDVCQPKGADAALYDAKRNSRNTLSVFDGRSGASFQRSQRDDGDNASMLLVS